MKEILITKIELNGEIFKGMTMRGKGFIQPVKYTTIEGKIIDSFIDNTKKKSLPDTFARQERSIAGKAMFACYNDEGKYWGTTQKFIMGGMGGLVPSAH